MLYTSIPDCSLSPSHTCTPHATRRGPSDSRNGDTIERVFRLRAADLHMCTLRARHGFRFTPSDRACNPSIAAMSVVAWRFHRPINRAATSRQDIAQRGRACLLGEHPEGGIVTVQHRYVYPYCAPLDRSGDEETRRRERERRTRQRLGIETHQFLCAASVQREPSSWDKGGYLMCG